MLDLITSALEKTQSELLYRNESPLRLLKY